MENSTSTTQEKGLSKTTIALIALAVVGIGAAFLWPLISSMLMPAPTKLGKSDTVPAPAAAPTLPSGNDWVSAEAVNKRILGNYAKWTDLGLSEATKEADMKIPAKKAKWDQYYAYWGKINELFGDPAKNNIEPLVSGFMKGMDISQTANNVAIFRTYIQEYIDNPTHMYHWELKQGQLLGK